MFQGATAKDEKRELQKFLWRKHIQNGGGGATAQRWPQPGARASKAGTDAMQAPPSGRGSIRNGPGTRSEKRSIAGEVARILDSNPSFIYAESSRCYASIVYGTRKCK